uniref:Uncharacterized protein n=1 Tax=Trichuris muris TaxID=70415 RepID=A0A5S6Q768_TRIMR
MPTASRGGQTLRIGCLVASSCAAAFLYRNRLPLEDSNLSIIKRVPGQSQLCAFGVVVEPANLTVRFRAIENRIRHSMVCASVGHRKCLRGAKSVQSARQLRLPSFRGVEGRGQFLENFKQSVCVILFAGASALLRANCLNRRHESRNLNFVERKQRHRVMPNANREKQTGDMLTNSRVCRQRCINHLQTVKQSNSTREDFLPTAVKACFWPTYGEQIRRMDGKAALSVVIELLFIMGICRRNKEEKRTPHVSLFVTAKHVNGSLRE